MTNVSSPVTSLTYHNCLGIGSYICGRPITQALHVKSLSFRRTIVCIRYAIELDTGGRHQINGYACTRRRICAEIRGINGIYTVKEIHRREEQIYVGTVCKIQRIYSEDLCAKKMSEPRGWMNGAEHTLELTEAFFHLLFNRNLPGDIRHWHLHVCDGNPRIKIPARYTFTPWFCLVNW